MIERPRLAPCPSCRRHLRVAERDCPFCGAPIASGSLVARTSVPRRTLGRAAIFAFGSAIAATAPGCYLVHGRSEAERANVDAAHEEEDAGSVGLLYGTPPGFDEPDAAVAIDAARLDAAEDPDSGGYVTLYGGPFPDFVDSGMDDAAGGAMNLYGGPPGEDGGSEG